MKQLISLVAVLSVAASAAAETHPFAADAARAAALLGPGFFSAAPAAFATERESSPACMGLERPAVDDATIDVFLEAVAYLSSSYDRNQRIEECYGRAKQRLSWRQARRLIDGLRDTYYKDSTYGIYSTRNRMSESYLKAHARSLDPRTAIEAASRQSSAYDRNRLIEEYDATRRGDLDWEPVRGLLSGVADTYYKDNTYGVYPVRNRMSEAFLRDRIHGLTPRLAVEVASWQSSGYDRNRLIEEYFGAHKEHLPWGEVQALIGGLAETHYRDSTYGTNAVRDRIIKAWTDCRR